MNKRHLLDWQYIENNLLTLSFSYATNQLRSEIKINAIINLVDQIFEVLIFYHYLHISNNKTWPFP